MSSKQPDSWTKSEVQKGSTDREQMPIPTPPDQDDPDIEGTLVPKSWMKYGNYPMPGMLECTAYLCSALETEPDKSGKITLKYVHVNKDVSIYVPVAVTETREGRYAPVEMMNGGQFDVGVNFSTLAEPIGEPPTESERRAVWNLHEDHIRSETRFLPTDLL